MITGLLQAIKNDATVQSRVGQNQASNTHKVYPVVCPQGEEPPYILVRLGSREPRGAGKSCNPTYDELIVVVASYSDKYSEIENLDSASFHVLEGATGTIEGSEWDFIRLVDSKDMFDESANCFVRISEYKAPLKR